MITHNIPFSVLKRLNYPKSAAMSLFSDGLKNEFETAMVNEPSVFEPLKFYCTWYLSLKLRAIAGKMFYGGRLAEREEEVTITKIFDYFFKKLIKVAYFQPVTTRIRNTVELQWLEHLWNHENMFETGTVRANVC